MAIDLSEEVACLTLQPQLRHDVDLWLLLLPASPAVPTLPYCERTVVQHVPCVAADDACTHFVESKTPSPTPTPLHAHVAEEHKSPLVARINSVIRSERELLGFEGALFI